jgi:hypothetical protein
MPSAPPNTLKRTSEYSAWIRRHSTYRRKPNVAVLVAISLMGIAACRAMSGGLMATILFGSTEGNAVLDNSLGRDSRRQSPLSGDKVPSPLYSQK